MDGKKRQRVRKKALNIPINGTVYNMGYGDYTVAVNNNEKVVPVGVFNSGSYTQCGMLNCQNNNILRFLVPWTNGEVDIFYDIVSD